MTACRRTQPAAGRDDEYPRAHRLAVTRHTSGRAAVPLWLQFTTFGLALAGLGVSICLTIAHFTDKPLAGCSESGALFIIGSICLYCTSVHVITFVLFGLVAFAAAAWGLPERQRG